MDEPVVGVLSPFVGGAYYGALLAAIGKAAARTGSRVIAIQTLDAAADMTVNGGPPGFVAPISWEQAAGFIALPDAVIPSYLTKLHATGKPVVLLGHEVDEARFPTVLSDNASGIREAVGHLIAHGHRRIAFGGYLAATDVAERYQAYLDTLRGHGIPPDPALLLPATNNLESGLGDVARHAVWPDVTAVVAGTDRNAIGLMRALQARGLRPPGDYALVGFDNTDVAPFLDPPLASVRQLFEAMGVTAVDLLLRMIAGQSVPWTCRVPTVFVPRNSCGCAGTDTMLQPSALAGAARLAERLTVLLPPLGVRAAADTHVLQQAVDAVVDGVDAALQGRSVGYEAMAAPLLALYALRPQPESLHLAARAVQEYGHSVSDDSRRVDACVQELMVVLGRAHGQVQFAGRWRLRATISAHYEVSVALLHRRAADPLDPSWLAVTGASAACIGMWSDDGSLLVTPGWRREPGTPVAGGVTSVAAFPPPALIAAAGPEEITFVVPAKVNTSDRGLLAVVGAVETSVEDGRELVNQCAALLTIALDLRRAALSDHLTGLPNRPALVDRLEAAVRRDTGRRFGVLFLDLDGFKLVNDTLGHAAGDKLLIHVAERIRRSLRPGDMAARFGGDEFVVLVDDVTSADQLTEIAGRLREAITAPFDMAGTAIRIGVSIGATTSEDRHTADEILLDADAAMYRAKAGGLGR